MRPFAAPELPSTPVKLKRLAIDPGDIHVGWAYGTPDGVDTGEWTPMGCTDQVVSLMTRNEIDELVIEEFVLYPTEAANQTWSPMQTSQLIGALKLIARWFDVPVVIQGAYIKKPTRKQLVARKIDTGGCSIHARDALLHLYHRSLREDQK